MKAYFNKILMPLLALAVIFVLEGCGTGRLANQSRSKDSAVGSAVGGVAGEAGAVAGKAVGIAAEDAVAMEDDMAVPMSEPDAMTSPSESPAAPIVMSALDHEDFYIEVSRIVPKKYPPKETMDGYSVSVKDNLLKCYLPYIGEMQAALSNSDAVAINANKVPVKTKVTMNPPYKKCFALVEFTFKSKYNSEVFYFKVEVFKNGVSYITVQSQFRDPITYMGRLENRQE